MTELKTRLAICAACNKNESGFCTDGRRRVEDLVANERVSCSEWPDVQQERIAREAPRKSIEKLVVITSYFNPCGYNRIRENYDRFAEGMRNDGAELLTVEMALDDDPYQLSSQCRLRGRRDHHQLWQKERLLNHAIENLSDDVDAVAWIDCDIQFLNRNWVEETKRALETLHVVQLFEDCYTQLPSGKIEPMKPSTGFAYATGLRDFHDVRKYHPGYAWAGRFEWLKEIGLMQTHLTGGADCLMLAGFTGCSMLMDSQLNPELLNESRKWSVEAFDRIRGAFGYVPGSILHLYHGSRKNRRYWERHRYLAEFDPQTDIEVEDELLRWTDHALTTKPEMVAKVAGYFAERKEDD